MKLITAVNLVLLTFLIGCSSKHQTDDVEVLKITELSKDIFLPQQIFTEIEKDINNDLKGAPASYVFVPLQVKFSQSNSLALKKEEVIYVLPKGGGLIDLKDIVEGQGSFYLSFPKDQFVDLPELEHLFYISQSPNQIIDGEKFGLGCNKWIDLKKQFSNMQKSNFLKTNTSSQRHQYVLNGTYIFVFRKASQVYLTQLSITDSVNKIAICPNNFKEKS